MAEMPESHAGNSDRKSPATAAGASNVAAKRDEPDSASEPLMEAVVVRENLLRAYSRVLSNKGAAGVDGMSVEQLKPYLQQHWAEIKEALLEDNYQPQAVRLVEIEKPNGGVRQLGIPTVVDRLIQQALHQVLSPLFEPGFSDSSYGFRPSRNAHQAIAQARAYVCGGRRWVVDIDLEKFFDRVNHDILMTRVARKVKDKRVLRLIRRYLQAGMMSGGVVSPRAEGTPQGGPLSPLLSNILLDELDKELERRGHQFVRYADDCNIYVQSQVAGERVMASISKFLEQRLGLRVNSEKSAVARPWKRKFLGYTMTWHKQPRLKVAGESVNRLKAKLRTKIREAKGRKLEECIKELEPILRGWVNYYRLAEVKGIFEELDGWLRRKLRCLVWRRWKRPLTRAKNLMKRGLAEVRAWRSATNGHGPWWNAGASHMNEAYPKSYFDRLGLVSLLERRRALQRT